MDLNKRAEKYNPDSFASGVLGWAETVVMAVFVVILMFTFVFKIVVVVGSSMENTLFQDDRLIISNLCYDPSRGDIVVINSGVMDEVIVKRVIATAGETVRIDYNRCEVEIDGEVLDEPYIKEQMVNTGSFSEAFYDSENDRYEYKVPFGYVFVMGDNRNHSTDSREIGLVSEDEILGRVVFRFYSDKAENGRVA